ncbi:MAG: DUF3313 family protein [bacterium]|nr:DUF3313 family protein [Gammaproteobacteria bacterium]HIL94619.1 DUF3313 family protein [Pseudomonadales bacterium]
MHVETKIIIVSLALGLCNLALAAKQETETTYDGLVPIDKGAFKLSWADPDVDFTHYNKVIPGGAYFQFRAVKKTSTLQSQRNNAREFWIDDSNKQKLEETVGDIFSEEIAKSNEFEIVSEPGPHTLVLRGGLFDIISRVPPEQMGRGEIYLSSVGEATLVIEAIDSLSGEVIYRAVERRAAQSAATSLMPANTVTTWSEVRRWARQWATRLRKALDSIHD